MRTHGEGGLEKIGHIWYFTFYNLNGKQVRRSSKSKLKSVAIAMLQDSPDAIKKGTESACTHKLKYEDIRAILLADYLDSGKATMKDDELLISGRKGVLKTLDDFFGGMRVQAITTDVLRKFVAKRKDEDDVEGPTVNRNLAMIRRMFKLLRSTCRQDFSTAIYSIQQFFPEFCNQSPQWALRAALDAVNVEVHRSHKGAAQSLASLERTNRLTPKLLWV